MTKDGDNSEQKAWSVGYDVKDRHEEETIDGGGFLVHDRSWPEKGTRLNEEGKSNWRKMCKFSRKKERSKINEKEKKMTWSAAEKKNGIDSLLWYYVIIHGKQIVKVRKWRKGKREREKKKEKKGN